MNASLGTNEMLNELNRLRREDGKVPLKMWGGTHAQLHAAIVKRKLDRVEKPSDVDLVEEYLNNGGEIHQAPTKTAKGIKRPLRRVINMQTGKELHPRRVRSQQADKPHKKKVEADQFSLVTLAEHQGVKPLRARTLARDNPEVQALAISRWVFHRKDWDAVGKLLWGNRWKG